jgi:hypothetical protein
MGVSEVTITSPYVHSRIDFNTFTMGNPMQESTLVYARVDLPQSGTLEEQAALCDALKQLYSMEL